MADLKFTGTVENEDGVQYLVRLVVEQLTMIAIMSGLPQADVLKKISLSIAESAKIDIELIDPPDDSDSTILPDGNWTGLIGILQRGIWMLLGVSTFLAAICCHMFDILSSGERYGMLNYFYDFFCAYVSQTREKRKQHLCEKILKTIFWMSVILLHTLIGAYITLNLIVEEQLDQIDSLEDLFAEREKNPELNVFLPNMLGLYDIVASGATEDYRKLKKIVSYHEHLNGDDVKFCGGPVITEMIHTGKAVIVDSEEINVQCQALQCKNVDVKLHISQHVVNELLLAVPFRRDFDPYLRRKFNKALKSIQESGLFDFLSKNAIQLPKCLREFNEVNVEDFASVNMKTVSVCFIILILGLFISIFTFITEVALNACSGKKTKSAGRKEKRGKGLPTA